MQGTPRARFLMKTQARNRYLLIVGSARAAEPPVLGARIMDKIVYIVSRFTSASRSAKAHADDGEGLPLCNEKPRGRFNGWSQDDGDIDCEKCLTIIATSN